MGVLGFLNKKRAEAILLIIFAFFVMFLKIGQPWGYSISHTYPQFFNANDNFLHSALSEYVKNVGNYAFAPPYFSGGYDDVVGYIPPLIHHLSAMTSYLTGLETYDTTYLVTAFLMVSGFLLVYFAIKKVNGTLALLSLPFMLGVYSFTFEIARAWGLWIFITGSFFLFAFIWCMENFEKKYMFVLLALFLSGMAIGHTTEMLFGLGFLVFYCVVKLMRKGFNRTELINLALGLFIFLIVSAYFLAIFYFTWMKIQPFEFSVMEKPVFAPNFPVNLWDFGATQFLLYAGLLFFIFLVIIKDDSEKLKVDPFSSTILAGIFLLIMGFTNYVGFGVRAFQTRIFWPVYLAVLMGLALYFIPAHFKKWRFRYAAAIAGVLLLVFFFNNYGGLQGPGIIDQQVWNGFKWLSENTPENATVYHFYSKPATQFDSLFSTKRVSYTVNMDDYINSLKAGIIKSEYNSDKTALTDTHLPYRSSLFSYGYHATEDEFKKTISMWDMDYYFFVTYDPSDPSNTLMLYNRYVGDYMLNRTWVEVAYSNDEVLILKNNEPGRKT